MSENNNPNENNNNNSSLPTQEKVVGDTKYKISSIDPLFIVVQYDVIEDNIRNNIREHLISLGFVRQTYSVYEGLFSATLVEEIERLAANSKRARVKYITPSLPDYQATLERDEYEAKFAAQFEDLAKEIRRIDDMLEDQIFYVKKGETEDQARPFTALQIAQHIRSAVSYAEDLKSALAKRAARDCDDLSKRLLAQRELRMKELDAFISSLISRNERRKIAEGRKNPGVSGNVVGGVLL